jgi:hypothetical protein
VFAFERGLSDVRVYIVLNRSSQSHTVKLEVGHEDGSATLIDWTREDQAAVEFSQQQEAGRPEISPRDDGRGFKVVNGTVTITLPAYGSAVLGRAK